MHLRDFKVHLNKNMDLTNSDFKFVVVKNIFIFLN